METNARNTVAYASDGQAEGEGPGREASPPADDADAADEDDDGRHRGEDSHF